MAELIAYYNNAFKPTERWELPLDTPQVLGRETALSPLWDPKISRKQANLCWDGATLEVRRHPEGRAWMEFNGRPADRFSVTPGGRFTIGGTEFLLFDNATIVDRGPDDDAPDEELTYPAGTVVFSDPSKRLDLLSRLPNLVTDSKNDYYHGLLELISEGMPSADAVLLIAPGGEPTAEEQPDVARSRAFHVLSRREPGGRQSRPSHSLIRKAMSKRRSVLYKWNDRSADKSDINADGSDYSVAAGIDWAFCTPLPGAYGGGRAFYAQGRTSVTPNFDEWDPREDVKFVELVASYAASLRQNSLLTRQQAVLGQFFSPKVLRGLSIADAEKFLEPREAQVTVLFCDLRGFSRVSEEHADDLKGLLDRVSSALGVTTRHILRHDGVIGDFQGDSAMGFWGWPIERPESDAADACRVALAIRAEMDAASETPRWPPWATSGWASAWPAALPSPVGSAPKIRAKSPSSVRSSTSLQDSKA